MRRRRRSTQRPAPARPTPEWSRHKMLALLGGTAAVAVLLVVGVVLAVVHAVHPSRHTAGPSTTSPDAGVRGGDGTGSRPPASVTDPKDVLAAAVMPAVDADGSHPGPVSTADPGTPITLPAAIAAGPAQVPTGFPRTPEGAMAQLAAIDQTALQDATLQGARDVISGWAMPGGPTPTTWSGVQAIAEFFDAAGLSGGGANQLAVVASPLMGVIKGSVGDDFVVPCVDFELDVTLQQTTRGAVADCQRMQWNGTRWMVGPGLEPATPPSVWPDTDVAIAVGYRDLRHA